MPTTTPRLGMPVLAAGQADGEVYHNQALTELDALTGGYALSRTTSAPPAAVNGDTYIIGASPTGVWAGKAGYIAHYSSGQWNYYAPKSGYTMWVASENSRVHYLTSAWKARTGENILAMRLAANQTYTTWAGILWDAEIRKDAGCYTHSTSSNKDQITLTEAGEYHVSANITFEQTDTAAYNFSEARLTINGSLVTGATVRSTTHFGNQDIMTVSINQVIVAAANDILRIEVQRHTGAAALRVMAGYTRATIRRV